MEERGTSKAETLEGLRDTTGKSFRNADLEKLIKKYDSKAYVQYSRFAKSPDGARTQGGLGFLSNESKIPFTLFTCGSFLWSIIFQQ